MDIRELVAGKGAATRYALLAGVSALALGAAPAHAGNILLTGHDNDFHCTEDSDFHTSPGVGPCEAIKAEAAFVTAGDTAASAANSILSIDQGSELTSALIADGYSVTTKHASTVTAADFDATKYSAFAVASVTSCGGCDNPPGTGATLALLSAAIGSFVDAGGGILGLTSAGDDLTGFSYVPDSAGVTVPIFHDSGFVATANGISDIGGGFDSVNGDETHNIFGEPGSVGGPSSVYKVAERDSTDPTADSPDGVPVTLYVKGASITCAAAGTCTVHGSVPEPSSLALLGVGLFGFGVARRRRKNLAA